MMSVVLHGSGLVNEFIGVPDEPFNGGIVPKKGNKIILREFSPFSPTSRRGDERMVSELGTVEVIQVTKELVITKASQNGKVESFKITDFIAGLLRAEELVQV